MKMIRACVLLVVCVLAVAARGQDSQVRGGPREWLSVKVGAKTTMKYVLALPVGFDKEKEYPVLLAMPPAVQDERMVEDALNTYWEREARTRGWVVVSPASPTGEADFRWEIDPLLDDIAKRVKVEGGKYHLTGVSNGGISAFNLAVREPERFASLTTLPGHPANAGDFAKLVKIKDIPVTMFVGEQDVRWHDEGRKTEDKLKKLGGKVKFEIVKGEGHVMNLKPKDLFDLFESHRPRAAPAPVVEPPEVVAARSAVSAVLDDFHDAAAKADFDRYFAHFADGAVFIGTDSTERWTVDEFKAYCEPNFRIGKGWTYTPVVRHVDFSPRGDVAWFDELVENTKYGLCRGSGVLVKAPGAAKGADAKAEPAWKVKQYTLSFTLPNESAESVMKGIKSKQKRPASGGTGGASDDAKDEKKK